MDFLVSIVSHWKEALAVVVVLGGLIFFHELGHFCMARLLGIGVRTFSLGFGPKLLQRRWGKTDYCLSAVPLGGYVSLAGEEEEGDEKDAPAKAQATQNDPLQDELLYAPEEEFSKHPAWHRLLVVLAGPTANFVLALIVYWGIAWAQGQSYLLPNVGGVLEKSPAAVAGISAGDSIISLNGKPITDWREISQGVGAAKGEPVKLVIARNGIERSLTLTPESRTIPTIFGEQKQAWLLGIDASGETGHIPLGPIDAIGAGAQKTWDMIAFTCESIVKLVQRVVPLDNVGGPILIAQEIGKQSQQGAVSVLMLAAFISINLGILNLLPIPVLDGGHIVFFTLEMIMGKPVSARIRGASAQVGMALLLMLMVFATWNDLARLFS